MDKFFAVVIGGGIGSLFRYWISLLAAFLFGTAFPYGTLIVNLLGCFVIGVVFSLAQHTGLITPVARLFIITGFLGGLTTFSSYAIETINLEQSAQAASALINILTNNVLGLIMVVLGLWFGRFVSGGL